MKSNKIYTFRDNQFYTPLIERAELLEQKRLADLYNHYHHTKYTAKEIVDTLNSIGYDWKRLYVDLLNGLEVPQLMPADTELTDEYFSITGDLFNDLSIAQIAVGILQMELDDALSKSDKIKKERELRTKESYLRGIEKEVDQFTKRFNQIKNMDIDAKFLESQGDYRLELKGDYAWRFSDSRVSHWDEIKTYLDKFHITGSGSMLFLTPLIQSSKISERGDKLVVTFTHEGVDNIVRKFLNRKFKESNTYPVYEDGNNTILSSEMLKFFSLDGVGLFYEPAPLMPDSEVVNKYNTNTKEGLESIVRDTFNKKKAHFDLWYGK